MLDTIKQILNSEGIDRFGIIPFKECEVINARILPENVKSAIIFCIPYRSVKETASDGFSEYSRIYDYHNYSKELYARILTKLSSALDNPFYGFCDHSPINEKLAAAKCGLGVIGRNSLFIDEKYGSFIFIGSLLTTAEFETKVFDIKSCINCGKCVSACPSKAITDKGIDPQKCLSALSQSKRRTESESFILKKHHIAWGCDICQNICPYNENAVISPIKVFSETRINHIDKEFIESLSDEEFKKYAFSYKGRKIVLDNISNINE